VPAQDQREDVAHRDLEFLGYEGTVAGGVEDAGHPDHALAREAARLQRYVAHSVQRVRHDHDDAVRRVFHQLLGYALDDPLILVEQVFAAHPRLAGLAAGYDDYVRARGLLVAVRADDV
jgi:hypothetical protein